MDRRYILFLLETKPRRAAATRRLCTLFTSLRECCADFWGRLKKTWVGPKGRPARNWEHLGWHVLCFLMQARSTSQGIRLRRLLSGKKISRFKFPFTFVSVALCCLLSSPQPQGSRCPFPADICMPSVVSCTPSTEPPFSPHRLGSGSQRAAGFPKPWQSFLELWVCCAVQLPGAGGSGSCGKCQGKISDRNREREQLPPVCRKGRMGRQHTEMRNVDFSVGSLLSYHWLSLFHVFASLLEN